jgi:hypothetical protein
VKYTIPATGFQSQDIGAVFHEYFNRVSDPAVMAASWDAPWRRIIVEAVTDTKAQSVYEIGCGAGPNLRRLRHEMPHLTLGGCDFSDSQVATAAQYGEVTVQTLPCKVGAGWEATLSCYALAYLDPGGVEEALLQIESPWLIVAEPMAEGACHFIVQLNGSIPIWAHDYLHLLQRAGWTPVKSGSPEGAPDLLNRIIIAKRGT